MGRVLSNAENVESAVAQVRARGGARRALVGAALGLAGGAVLAGVGGSVAWALLAALGAALGFASRASPVHAARWLDAQASQDGAIECAWDNRLRTTPHAVAQRARAAAALPPARPALGPAMAALTGALALWAWPLTQTPATVSPVAQPENPAPGAPIPAETPQTADAGAGRTVAKAEPPTTDLGVSSDGGAGGQQAATAKVGGVGLNAGDQPGDRVAVGEAPRLTNPGERVAVGPGDIQSTARRAGVVPPGPIPAGMDDIADPARAYPRRHRAVVTAWFDRKGDR